MSLLDQLKSRKALKPSTTKESNIFDQETLKKTFKVSDIQTQLKPYKFDPQTNCWQQVSCVQEPQPLRPITLATYNIWFSQHQLSNRMFHVNKILNETEADIIAVQEMKPFMLKNYFINSDWLKKSYFISDISGDTFIDYGVMLFSKIPFHRLFLHRIPSQMGRKVLIAEFEFSEGVSLAVATTHLESHDLASEYRRKQIDAILVHISKYENCVVMGDFNFASEKESEAFPRRFKDAWTELRGSENGETFLRRRLDRVLFSGNSFEFSGVFKIGTVPIDIDRAELEAEKKRKEDKVSGLPGFLGELKKFSKKVGEGELSDVTGSLFPSDHFGVCCVLRPKNSV